MYIKYQDCISLGFIREEMPEDDVWFNQHGYDFFALRLSVGGNFFFDWDIESGIVTIQRENEHQIIVDKAEVKELSKLILAIEYFSIPENQTELSFLTIASTL